MRSWPHSVGRGPGWRRPGPAGALSVAGSMAIEARPPGLDPREVPILPTFTPDIAAALPGPSWLTVGVAAAAEAFAGSPLPTEKDEVWRYSRIDQLDLDRFHPAGTAARATTRDRRSSERIHALVDGLGARSGLVVTINGVLATLSATVEDDVVSLGRVADHADGGD